MIEYELLFLGLLKESPKHGYEIKIKIREILSIFAGVDLKSIYYPLRVLEAKGLVKKHIARPSRRPARIVYELTRKGEARFNLLLNRSLLDFKRPRFSLDLSIYFLHYLNPEISRRRLKARMLILKRLCAGLREMISSRKNKKPFSLAYILEHDLEMVESEYAFLGRLIKRF